MNRSQNLSHCMAFLLFLLLFNLSNGKGMTMSIAELSPDGTQGWEKSADRTYDRNTIFDYIDGGGEVYLTYNFRELLVRKFRREGQPEITAEIFDMGTPSDAFGIFSFEREGDSIGIGQDSEYDPGFLRFWKGQYFVIISSEQETSEVKKALIDLGTIIAGRIKDAGQKPLLLDFLPHEGLLANEIRFFHQAFNLNYHYFVAERNILNLDETTDACLAPYLVKGMRSMLLVVSYQSDEKAHKAYQSFTSVYMPEEGETGIIMTENKKWTAIKVWKNSIIIFFDGSSKENSLKIIDEAFALMKTKRSMH